MTCKHCGKEIMPWQITDRGGGKVGKTLYYHTDHQFSSTFLQNGHYPEPSTKQDTLKFIKKCLEKS